MAELLKVEPKAAESGLAELGLQAKSVIASLLTRSKCFM